MNDLTVNAPLSIDKKLAWLQDRYWKFGAEEDISDRLLDLFEVDEEGRRTAMPRLDPLTGETKGLMVLGASGNGKTALLKRALRADPVLKEFGVGQGGNTLYITVPPEATIKKLAEIILRETGYQKIDAKLRAADAWESARHRIGLLGINALVIDECHHILRTGAGRDIPAAIQALKHLLQGAQRVTLIIAGVPGLKDAILSEASGETMRRFIELSLSGIRPGSRGAATFAKNFMKSAEVLGLHVSDEDMLPERILFAEHGQVGKSIGLAKEILRAALIRGHESVTLDAAERVFRKSYGGIDFTPFENADWAGVKSELLAIGWGQ